MTPPPATNCGSAGGRPDDIIFRLRAGVPSVTPAARIPSLSGQARHGAEGISARQELHAIEPAVERWQRREVVRRRADHRVAIGPHLERDDPERRRDDARIDSQRHPRRRLIAHLQLIHLVRPVAAGQAPEPRPNDDVEGVGHAHGGRSVEHDERIVGRRRRGGDGARELDRDALGPRGLRRHRRCREQEMATNGASRPTKRIVTRLLAISPCCRSVCRVIRVIRVP